MLKKTTYSVCCVIAMMCGSAKAHCNEMEQIKCSQSLEDTGDKKYFTIDKATTLAIYNHLMNGQDLSVHDTSVQFYDTKNDDDDLL